MKKLLLFLGLLLFIMPVKAKTIYSDYLEFSDWQEKEIKSSETIKVETKKKYKYYYLEKVEGGYFGKNDNSGEYDQIIQDKKEYGDWSPWQNEKIEANNYNDIETKEAYSYANSKGIRYVYITDTYGSNSSLRITELYFVIKGQIVYPNVIACNGCNDTFNEFIFNGNPNQNMSSIANGGAIALDLGAYYDPRDVMLKIWVYDRGTDAKSFNAYYTHDMDINKAYAKYSFYSTYTNSNLYDVPSTDLYINSFIANKQNIEYEPSKIIYDNIKSDDYNQINPITLYRSREIKYMHYKSVPVYSDYLDDKTDIYNIKSKESKTYYRYATRHYFKVDDDIILKNSDIGKYIDSDLPYNIDTSIDYSKDGEYKVSISNEYLKYDFKVKVENDSNKDKQINANTEVMNKQNSEIVDLQEANQYLSQTIDVKEQEKASIEHNYQNKLENKNNVISNLSNSTESVSIKTSSILSNNNFYVGISFLVISLLVATYIYFRK